MAGRGHLAWLWIGVSAILPAQQYTHLSGLILDPSDAGIPGAVITAVNQDTGFRRVTESQPGGGYGIASLHPGFYKITVRKEGFRSVIRFGVKLDVSQPARIDFQLPVGSIEESITVEGSAPPLNTEDASVGTLVGRDRIERLPLNGRGLLSLLELAPGVVATPATRGEPGQFTANGQRPNTHYFTVDGVSANTGVSAGGTPAQATGGSLPGMTAFGSLHGLVSLEALDEFRVQTSTLVPEFGRMPGAQVTLSSRSGANDLHGSLFHYFRHELLDANDWFANRHGEGRAPLRMNDFGGSLGGPVRRNRTFFFLSYEGMRFRQPFAWRSVVPTPAAREEAPEWARPLLDLFPAPNGPMLGNQMAEWTGRNDRPSRLDAGSARFDHAATSRVTVFARYSHAPSSSEYGAAQTGALALSSRSLTFGANLRARAGLILDVRANVSSALGRAEWRHAGARLPECYLEPVTSQFLRKDGLCGYFVRFSLAGLGQLWNGREGDKSQSQWHVLPTLNWSRGAHALRLGADYRRLAPQRRDASGQLSIVAESFADLTASHNLWVAYSGPLAGRSAVEEVSAFAQDTWRIAHRLTATYGLRWEFSPPPSLEQSVLATREAWKARYTNLAPRFGVAFRPTSSPHTVLRAGAGLSYDSSLAVATDLVNGGPLSMDQYSSGRFGLFASTLIYGFAPDLRLPAVKHWSVLAEHAFRGKEVVSLGYVGSAGRRLLRREMGGEGSTGLVWLALATNRGESDHHGLQLQYRRRLARRLQTLVSYTWAHSLDNSSTDALLYWAGGGLGPERDRASSDFDVRHALTAAFTYEGGKPRGWALDGVFRARSGFPVDILQAEQSMGIAFANAFRPGLRPGQAVWLADALAPGGRKLNPAAFQKTSGQTQGGLGRNTIAGFGMGQLDLAVRREFSLGERAGWQLRVEVFNALNQANFADPVRFLSSPLFGQSPSMLNLMLGSGSPGSGLAPMLQNGGARSVQVVARFRF